MTLTNQTGATISEIDWSAADADDWSAVSTTSLSDGSSTTLSLPPGRCDVRVLDASGEAVLTVLGVEAKDGGTLDVVR